MASGAARPRATGAQSFDAHREGTLPRLWCGGALVRGGGWTDRGAHGLTRMAVGSIRADFYGCVPTAPPLATSARHCWGQDATPTSACAVAVWPKRDAGSDRERVGTDHTEPTTSAARSPAIGRSERAGGYFDGTRQREIAASALSARHPVGGSSTALSGVKASLRLDAIVTASPVAGSRPSRSGRS